MVIKMLLFLYPKAGKNYQYQCDSKRTADVTITHNLKQVLSNTLMSRYERIVNILKIPLKWEKINVRQKISRRLRSNLLIPKFGSQKLDFL